MLNPTEATKKKSKKKKALKNWNATWGNIHLMQKKAGRGREKQNETNRKQKAKWLT